MFGHAFDHVSMSVVEGTLFGGIACKDTYELSLEQEWNTDRASERWCETGGDLHQLQMCIRIHHRLLIRGAPARNAFAEADDQSPQQIMWITS